MKALGGLLNKNKVSAEDEKEFVRAIQAPLEEGRAQELLQSGAIPSNAMFKTNMTPLMYAAAFERLAVFNWLLDNGAKVNVRNSKGSSALNFVAAASGSVEMSKSLIEKGGANVHAKDNSGRTAIMYAVSAETLSFNPDLVRYLLSPKVGASLKDKNKYGQGLLSAAQADARHLLISEYGLEFDAQEKKLARSIDYAANHSRVVADKARERQLNKIERLVRERKIYNNLNHSSFPECQALLDHYFLSQISKSTTVGKMLLLLDKYLLPELSQIVMGYFSDEAIVAIISGDIAKKQLQEELETLLIPLKTYLVNGSLFVSSQKRYGDKISRELLNKIKAMQNISKVNLEELVVHVLQNKSKVPDLSLVAVLANILINIYAWKDNKKESRHAAVFKSVSEGDRIVEHKSITKQLIDFSPVLKDPDVEEEVFERYRFGGVSLLDADEEELGRVPVESGSTTKAALVVVDEGKRGVGAQAFKAGVVKPQTEIEVH